MNAKRFRRVVEAGETWAPK